MDFRVYSYRHAYYLFTGLEEYKHRWAEICEAIHDVSDEHIIREFESNSRNAKSVSQSVNRLLKAELVARGWEAESPIFADKAYKFEPNGKKKGTWRLDFAKGSLSVEVAFNHRSDIAWNLIKPTLASQLNHVPKAVQTDGGVIICATEKLKVAGGFDGAIGTFDDYVAYLRPMGQILTAPLVIVGLEAPETFRIEQETYKDPVTGSKKTIGHVVRINA